MKLIVLLGAPGSGKGTQAKRFASHHNVLYLATGDLFRKHVTEETALGKQAKEYMAKGELVPDSLVVNLLRSALADARDVGVAILDGFPRTVPQAVVLDERAETQVAQAVFFDAPQSVLIERLTGRLICEKCQATFHRSFFPPMKPGICDKCQGTLGQRKDDADSVVHNRLAIFYKQNGPLLSYYKNRSILSTIQADRAADGVEAEFAKVLSAFVA